MRKSRINVAWARTAALAIITPALVLFASGCDSSSGSNASGSTGAPDGDSPVSIVATTAMIANIVENVVGEHAEVRTLIGEGVDPHLYRPSRADMSALLDADIVFYNGLLLEGKMSDTFVQVQRTTPVYAVTELIDQWFLLAPDDLEGHDDPHVWMDPAGWINATEAVITSLAKEYPNHAASFEQNGAAYIEELRSLDDYASSCLASIPEEQRILITAHDAFNYFGRRYDLDVVGIQGISTDSEAGLAHIRELVNMIVSRKVRAIFTETSVSDKNVRALIEGARDAGHEVVIGGQLFSDAMGAPGTYEGTYIGMIDHNVTTITRALGGNAPRRGMNGKLAE